MSTRQLILTWIGSICIASGGGLFAWNVYGNAIVGLGVALVVLGLTTWITACNSE